MKIGVVVFPGSNCDHDAWYAFNQNLGVTAEYIWHDESSIAGCDAIVLPGGLFVWRLPPLRRDRAVCAGHGSGEEICG